MVCRAGQALLLGLKTPLTVLQPLDDRREGGLAMPGSRRG
jgi:hypothetical protein